MDGCILLFVKFPEEGSVETRHVLPRQRIPYRFKTLWNTFGDILLRISSIIE